MSKLWQTVLEWIRIIGNHSGCHQLAERSFFYKGKQFPVCARCTGVFFGQITALLMPVLKVKIPINVALGSLGIMGLDWGIQEIGILKSTNKRRAVTGFLGGFGLFSLYVIVIRKLLHK